MSYVEEISRLLTDHLAGWTLVTLSTLLAVGVLIWIFKAFVLQISPRLGLWIILWIIRGLAYLTWKMRGLGLGFDLEFGKTASQLDLDLQYLTTVTAPAMADYKPELGYTPIHVLYATDRAAADDLQDFYTSARGDLSFGLATVSIPRRHRPGHLERPSLLRFQIREDPQKHISIIDVAEMTSDQWLSVLRHSLPNDETRSILLFVHGYNVAFSEAVRRTAQLAYDLAFAGIPVLYSWPSSGTIKGYTADEATIDWTACNLEKVLQLIASSGLDEINAVAHSMGNRALTTAISRFAERNEPIHFNQMVLAAPDIDAKLFLDYLAPRLVELSRRCSLYASSGDQALALSQTVHAFPRAGEGEPNLVLAGGIDTIDASPVDMDLLGHGYFAENKQVIDDLFMLIRHGLSPDDRNLHRRNKGGVAYWLFP